MYKEFEMIEKLAPDMINALQKRYRILQNIYWMEPVGRRTLSEKLNLTERVLRTETDFLKSLQLIETSKTGMSLTEEGKVVYQGLENLMGQLFGIGDQEKMLANYLGIQRCIIVAGDSDVQAKITDTMGQTTVETLNFLLPQGDNIVAVMGGTTMAAVAENMSPRLSEKRKLTFVPARGGIGESVAIQANTISAQMATKSGSQNRMLYVPEQVSTETYKTLTQEPSVKEVLNLIKSADAVVHSIGGALRMAKRRDMSDEVIQMLKDKNAVGEAFGNFFNDEGEEVYKIPRIGIQLKELAGIDCVIAVAGGSSKGAAIHAYMKNAPVQTWLITDEGAATEILKGATH